MDARNLSAVDSKHHLDHSLYAGFQLNQAVILPTEGVVVRNEQRYHLPPKAMEILLFLTSKRDQVVHTSELLEFAWGDEKANRSLLTHAISEIRKALDDHKECPEFIQTFPRKGYRLIADFTLRNDSNSFPDFLSGHPPKNYSNASNNNNLNQVLWSLFRRSSLFSVSAAFVLTTWVLIQVLEVLFPIFNIPEWGLKLVVLALVVGFPIVLLFTLLKDLKIQRQRYRNQADFKRRYFRRLLLDFSVLGVVSVGATFTAFHLTQSLTQESETFASTFNLASKIDIPIKDNIIAIAPPVIENANSVPNYFSETLQSELSNTISNHSQFNVLTNNIFDKKATSNLEEQAKNAGARYLLNLRLNGLSNAISINMTIIDVTTRLQIWSNQTRVNVDQIQDVQNTISRKVIAALDLLSQSKSESNIAAIETGSFNAYENYLQGKQILLSANSSTELEQAEQFFLKSLSFDNNFQPAATALCQTYLEKYDLTRATGEFILAENICSRLLDFKNLNPRSYSTLGDLKRVGGNYIEAKAYYTSALEKKNDYLPAIIGMAEVFAANQQHEKALELFKQAVELEPGNWRYHQELGDYFFIRLGDYQTAAKHFQRVIFLQPENVQALNRLGAAYYLSNQFDKAVAAYTRSLELSASATTQSNLGTAYFFNQQYELATQHYQQAVNLEPQNTVYWGNLGDAEKYSGRASAAEKAYSTALDLALRNLSVNKNDLSTQAMVLRYRSELQSCLIVEEYLSELEANISRDPYFYYDLSVSALNCKLTTTAQSLISQAIANGYSKELLEQDIQFSSLAQYIKAQNNQGEKQ